MENIEKSQTYKKTNEVADKENEKNRKEFNKLIDNLEECDVITRLKDKRNSMTEEQKMKLYKSKAITIRGMLVRSTGIYPLYESLKDTVNRTKHTINNGFNNALKYDFLEKIPCRFLVQLGILQKPEGTTKNNLMEDIKKDAKNFHHYLGVCEGICTCIPDAAPAIPFIKTAKVFTKWYKDHGTEIITDRLEKQKELEVVSQQTNEALSTTIKEIKDNNKETKKAA